MRHHIEQAAPAGDGEAALGMPFRVGVPFQERLRPAQPGQRFAQAREILVGEGVDERGGPVGGLGGSHRVALVRLPERGDGQRPRLRDLVAQ